MLDHKSLQEFRKLCQKELGYVPEDSVLIKMATDLLTIMDVVFRPIKRSWIKNIKK